MFCSHVRYVCLYVCMHVCTKSFLKTTTNSLCVCTHLANKADSDYDYVSSLRRQLLGPFWGKVWYMSVTSLVLSYQVDRHALWHGVIGYRSPKCPLGRSVEFPRRETSRVTYVTVVAREGTRRCVPLPCLGLRVYVSSDNWVGDVFTRCPFILSGTCLWRHGPRGVVLHMLQTPVMLAAFTKVSTRTQRLVPSRGTMVT